MYIPEELKLNRFKECSIPRNKEYFARYGLVVTPSSQYSGDDPSPMPSTKIEDIEDFEAYAKIRAEEMNDPKND